MRERLPQPSAHPPWIFHFSLHGPLSTALRGAACTDVRISSPACASPRPHSRRHHRAPGPLPPAPSSLLEPLSAPPRATLRALGGARPCAAEGRWSRRAFLRS